MGVICLLASAKASEFVISATDSITVKVDKTSTGTAMQKCLTWYDALCLTGTGKSISENLTLDDTTFQKNKDNYGTHCDNLKTNYACTGDCSSRFESLIAFDALKLDIFPE